MSTQADCPGARRTTHSLSLLVRALLAASSFWFAGCAGLVKSSSTSPPPTLTISNPGSTNVTTTGAAVGWQTNVPATSQVEYGTTTYYGSTTAVDSTMVTIHQQSLSSLKPGTLYHFRVHSTDASNYSVASSDLTLTTAADTTPPTVSISSPVNGVTVSGTITVTANASDNVGVASVQFLLDGANLGSLDTASPYSVSWNTATASNASHALSAIAKDAAGNSTTSAGVTVTVNNAPATPPSITTQPVNQTVTAGQTARFTVVAAGTAPLGYQWQKNGASIAGATAASYTTPATTTADSGATFRVVVSNSAGTVTSSAATLTVNADTTAPTVPAGLSATAASSSQINLAWTASTDPDSGVTGYKVSRGGTQIGTSTTTSFSDSGLTASTTYSYTVAAFDAAGNTSAQSASASATTLASSGGGIPPTLGWYDLGAATQIAPNCPNPSPGGNTGCPGVIEAQNGGIADTVNNRMLIWGGGHQDYYGNEVYSLNLNANPIATTRITNNTPASQLNFTNCQTTGDTVQPDGQPTARHTYDDLVFMPPRGASGQMFSFGGALSNCGYSYADTWTFDLSTLAWNHLKDQNTSGQPPACNACVNDWDPNTNLVHLFVTDTGDLANLWTYDPAANSYTRRSTANNVVSNLQLGGAIDVGRKVFVTLGNGAFFKVDISSGSSYAIQNIAGTVTGCSVPMSATSPGVAYDPINKDLVIWQGGNTVYVFNADTNACTTVTYPNGPPSPPHADPLGNPYPSGSQQLDGTFGRFRYFPGLGVFVVVNDIGEDAFSLRLSPPSGTSAALQDFQNRCAAPGVIVCDGFDSAAAAPQRTCADNNSGIYPDCFDSTSTYMTIDSTTYRSGGGSMLATIPGTAGSDPTGYYRRLFQSSQSNGPGTATVFGQNSDFYVQYAQRMDSAYITNSWPANSGGPTYWKQQIISNDTGTCAQEEITTVNDFNEGYPLTYSACGATPFQKTVNSVLYNEFTQNLVTGSGAGGYNCPYGSAQPNANCFDYPANVWVTYYFHVHIGTWGSANSLVEGWVSTPSNLNYKQWLYMNNLTLNQDTGSPGFDMITLLAYWTNRNNTVSAGPISHTWYDELIVSSQPVAAPTTPPAAP